MTYLHPPQETRAGEDVARQFAADRAPGRSARMRARRWAGPYRR
ncbi:hypothetical protein [Dactylosporangium salmoneum]